MNRPSCQVILQKMSNIPPDGCGVKLNMCAIRARTRISDAILSTLTKTSRRKWSGGRHDGAPEQNRRNRFWLPADFRLRRYSMLQGVPWQHPSRGAGALNRHPSDSGRFARRNAGEKPIRMVIHYYQMNFFEKSPVLARVTPSRCFL